MECGRNIIFFYTIYNYRATILLHYLQIEVQQAPYLNTVTYKVGVPRK